MGTTMHTQIEVKANDQWHHWHAPIVEQNYRLFDLIAGVRGNEDRPIKPVAKIKGLPEDISLVTAIAYENDKDYGIHDTVVLNADDINELQDRIYEEVFPGTIHTGIDEGDLEYSIFHTYIGGGTIAAHKGFDDVRIIIWFDN